MVKKEASLSLFPKLSLFTPPEPLLFPDGGIYGKGEVRLEGCQLEKG